MAKKETSNEVAVIEKEISPVVAKAKALKIESPKDMRTSAEMISQLNKSLDGLTTSKEKLTKPINETLKEIRSRYKPSEVVLEAAILYIRNEQKRYQTEQVKNQLAEEAKIAERIGAGKGKLKVDTAIRKMDEVEKPAELVVAESGSVEFRKKNIVKVVKLELIPLEYFELDESKLLKALEAGVKVPGAEIDFEMTPVNRR